MSYATLAQLIELFLNFFERLLFIFYFVFVSLLTHPLKPMAKVGPWSNFTPSQQAHPSSGSEP